MSSLSEDCCLAVFFLALCISFNERTLSFLYLEEDLMRSSVVSITRSDIVSFFGRDTIFKNGTVSKNVKKEIDPRDYHTFFVTNQI